MSVLFRRLFRTAIFSRFSQVAIATLNFMNEFYNGGFTWKRNMEGRLEVLSYVPMYLPMYIYKYMVLQCSKLIYYKVSCEFLQQDSQRSYSFGKIQNVGETELSEERV